MGVAIEGTASAMRTSAVCCEYGTVRWGCSVVRVQCGASAVRYGVVRVGCGAGAVGVVSAV